MVCISGRRFLGQYFLKTRFGGRSRVDLIGDLRWEVSNENRSVLGLMSEVQTAYPAFDIDLTHQRTGAKNRRGFNGIVWSLSRRRVRFAIPLLEDNYIAVLRKRSGPYQL